MDILDQSMPVVDLRRARRPEGTLITHAVCIFHEADDVRAEVSCVVESSGGYFEGFSERIFILGGEAGTPDPVKRKGSDDDGSDFDIPVIRKK